MKNEILRSAAWDAAAKHVVLNPTSSRLNPKPLAPKPEFSPLSLLGGPGDLVKWVLSRVISTPKWSYPNYNPAYNRLSKSPGPPSKDALLSQRLHVPI